MQLINMKKLDKYIFGKLLPAFLINFIVLTIILLLDKLFEISELVITKGVPAYMVAQFLLYILPSLIVLTLPMAIIVSFMMVFGELSANHEVIACYSSGIHPYKLFKIPLIFALSIFFFLLYFNAFIWPKSNYHAKKVYVEIRAKKPGAQIVENQFINSIKGYRIYVGKMDYKKGILKNIFIYQTTKNGLRTIIADSGKMVANAEKGYLIFYLYNGSVYEPNKKDYNRLLRVDFHTQIISIKFSDDLKTVARKGDRELTSKELKENIKKIKSQLKKIEKEKKEYAKKLKLKKIPENKLKRLKKKYKILLMNIKNQYNEIDSLFIEYHKKSALAFSVLIFAFISFPLGIMTRKRQKSYSYIISIFVFLFYWFSLLGGEALGDRGYISPFFAMWFANIVLFFVALYLNYLLLKGHFYFSFVLFSKFKEKIGNYVKNISNR